MNTPSRSSLAEPAPSIPRPGASPPVFALVAGEDSGDQLGADLIEALRARFPDARFVGVGGPRMRAVGFEAWHDISWLSVMGLAEILRHLPRLLRLRASLTKRLIALKPDVLIGIDAPDFNLGMEKKLKRAGIRTLHYVSPSVWAWRARRARTIGDAADCVLCLFPMEPAIYEAHGVAASFVGHPLADRFPLVPDRDAARRELGIEPASPVLAVLPGSRLSEIRRLGAIFLEAARRVAEEIPGLQIVIPAANDRCGREIAKLLAGAGFGTRDPPPATAVAGRISAAPDSGNPSRPRANDATPGDALTRPDSADSREAGNPAPLATDGDSRDQRSSKSPAEGPRRPGNDGKHAGVPAPPARIVKPVMLLVGQAHRAMVAADVVLLASGTAALETMLAKRPMVVGYRIAPLTHAVVKGLGMLTTSVYSLPNVLAGKTLVPELMQGDCTPGKLADAVLRWFGDATARDALTRQFERMHLALHAGGGSAAAAARAIERTLASTPGKAKR